MANEIFLDNNEKFHVFSKSPITPSMGLAQAVNKSGHTTTTSDVWSQDIPWFFSVDDQATALTTGKDAKLNDLVLIGSNVFKRNDTAYSDSAAFTDLWESLTLEDGTQLYNSDGKHVLTYHKGVSVTFLTTANNAKQASNYAGRVFKSDGSVIEQFVASTDKVSSGVPSTGYGVAVYKSGSPLSQGEAESNFIANSYAGIIQFNTKVGPSTAYTADVFEYVGEKLNTTVAELKAAVFGEGGSDGEEDTSLSQKVAQNTAAIKTLTDTTVPAIAGRVTSVEEALDTLNGDDTTSGSIAKSIKDAIDELGDVAVKNDIKISDIKVQIGDGVATSLTPDENKSVTITIPEVEKATVTDGEITEGDEDKFVTAGDAKSVAEKAIETALADTTEGSLGDKINDVKEIAEAKVSSVTGPTEGHVIVSTDADTKAVTITASDIASATTLGQVQETANSAVQTVTAPGAEKSNTTVTITAATLNADNKSFTNDGYFVKASDVVTVATTIAGDAVDNIETTGTDVIEASSESTSTKLATEASVAKTVKTLEGKVTALDGKEITQQSVSGAGITVTLDGTVGAPTLTGGVTPATYTSSTKSWSNETNVAKASDVATAISDAVGAITVTTTTDAQNVGVTASGHEVDVATAAYTKAEFDETGKVTTEGSWTDTSKNYLVTGNIVRDFVGDETAKALEEAKAYSDSLHTTSLDYVVLADGESLPTASADTVGKIYLVPKANIPAEDGSALSGDYVEYMTRKVSETEYTWEKIGTTSADLNGYVNSIATANGVSGTVTNSVATIKVQDGNISQKGIVQLASTHEASDATKAATGATVAAAIAALDATNVGSGAVKVSQADGIVSSVTVATEALVENDSIKDATESDTALITAKDALAAIGLAKPDNYVASVTGYNTAGEEVTSTQGAEIKVLDSRGTTVTANDLWGTSVTTDGETITVDHKYLSNPNSDSYTAWNSSVKSVKDNKAYTSTDGSGEPLCNIQTDMIKDGTWMFSNTLLTSFDGDLSSLVNGSDMFYNTALTSFSGDLSNLVNGAYMFSGTQITSFSSDLSNLVDGNNMFYETFTLKSFSSDLSSLVNGSDMFGWSPLTSFNSDLSSLVNGNGMFGSTSLISFIGDLSSLVNGAAMFINAPLTSFIGDLSSLVNGNNMFSYSKLDTESIECIADTIRNVKDLSDSTITGSDGETYEVTKRIDIGIASKTPIVNEEENAAFWTMHNEKGWSVYVNDSEYNPTEPTAIATLDENGEEVTTPIPFWAKPVETDEEHAEYVSEDGKFYQVVGGQFIYVSDPETYGQFTSLADAVANMRLTKIEKKA